MRNALDTKTLLKKWSPILEAGNQKISSFETKKALATILENTAGEFERAGLLTEAQPGMAQGMAMGASPVGKTASTGYLKGPYGRQKAIPVGTDNIFYLPNVIMPMLRRIFPSLIAHELVGVQAMNGPTGYALAYRAKYGAHGELGTGALTGLTAEIGFNPVDTRFTGVNGKYPAKADGTSDALTALTSEWDPEASQAMGANGNMPNTISEEAWKAYGGAEKGRWNGQGAPLGVASEFARFSDGTYPTVSFDFIKTMVEARTRKLGAGWSPELAEDLEAVHGLDVESEFVNMISFEIGAEIDRQLVSEMVKAAITGGSVTSWSPAEADGLDQMGRLATLLTQVTLEAQNIAIRTRRGHANFVVTSPSVCALLEQMTFNKFVSIQNSKSEPSVPDSGVGALTKIGTINDGQQLLVRDTYAMGNYLLMGYKGAHPADNGIIYCPYIPVQLQKVINPDTLTPMIGARTRYGVMNSVWDAKNYYHFITIKDLTAGYEFNQSRKFVQSLSKVTNGTLFV